MLRDALPDSSEAEGALASARLDLRPMHGGDLDALHALLAQPGVRRFLCDGETLPRSAVAEMLAASARQRAEAGTGLWALRERARPRGLAGFVGWWEYRHLGSAAPASELAFALDEGCWGRGLATEAGETMLAYARDRLGWRQAQASTDLGNNASIRTLWRLGFAEAAIVPAPGGALRIFRRTL